MSSVATPGQNGSPPTIAVDAVPTDPAAIGHVDQAPVNVSITTGRVNNALVVPVDALLSLEEGGYAVEVVTNGVHHLVAVTTGMFDDADGLVQVSGPGLDGRSARGGTRRMSLLAGTPPTAPGVRRPRPARADRGRR